MKIEVKKVDTNKRQLDIEVPSDIVKQKFDDIYAQIAQEAKVPGFRPGKAPRNMLEKYHSKVAYEEVLRSLIPETYQKAIEKENIDVITYPEITEVELNSNILKYKATVETRPEVQIKNYKNIKLKYKKAALTDEDLNKTIDALAKAKKAETLDDKFAKSLGYATLSEFKDVLSKQLLEHKEHEERLNREKQIMDYLLENSNVLVPDSLVQHRLEELVKETKNRLLMRGMPKKEADEKDGELRKELRKDAETQVKLSLILDEIAKREKITGDNQTSSAVLEFLLKEADWEEVSA